MGRASTNGHSRWIELALVLAFALPINLGGLMMEGLPLATTDLLVLGVGIFIVRSIRVDGVSLWIIAFFAGSLLLAGVQVLLGQDMRPLFSVARFIAVYMSFFIGYSLNWNIPRLCRSLFWICVCFAGLMLCIIINTPILSLRDEIVLFDVPIFGTDGVNAFAVYSALCSMLLMGLIFAGYPRSRSGRAVGLAGALLCGVFPILVVSRQAILGIVLFLGMATLHVMRRRDAGAAGTVVRLVALAAIVASVGVVIVDVMSADDNVLLDLLTTKFDDLRLLADGDFSEGSAGRSDIIGLMFSDLVSSVSRFLFGSRFGGFSLDLLSSIGFDEVQGTSPHNQYVGAFFKAGAVLGVMYLVFLYRVYGLFARFRHVAQDIGSYLYYVAVICFILFMNTQDFLTFALTGHLFMLIAGVLWRLLNKNEDHAAASIAAA